jgi:hypothetical protein
MTPDIIRKLAVELNKGITSEVQVVYLLAGIRRIIEREESTPSYPDLKFHCDWALHASMDRTAARAILKLFDEAHAHLRNNIMINDLPSRLKREIERISKMETFEQSLEQFLSDHQLPPLTQHRTDGWTHFLHLYTQVIEDIPLMIFAPPGRQGTTTHRTNYPQHISRVTVHCELARETIKHD